MNIKLSRLDRWVRLFLALQMGAGALMLRYSQPALSQALLGVSGALGLTSALGVRPLILVWNYLEGSQDPTSRTDAA